MDESNVDVTPTKFKENCSKWDWILESASHEDLFKALDFLKQKNNEVDDNTTEMIVKSIAKHVMI